MKIKKGDLVTRKSYEHDTVFKVVNIKDGIYYLKGLDVRLYADSPYKDLELFEDEVQEDDLEEALKDSGIADRNEFFYLPAKILHLDGDEDYLKRSLNLYKEAGVFAIGKKIKENEIPLSIEKLLKDYRPDIVIITGHDAFYRKKGDQKDLNNYKNTLNFIKSVQIARSYEKSHEKLVIIAGACQSNYEELIKAGANFASSPRRVNIHALDPAIIAINISLTERSEEVDLISLLEKTKYGKDGIGGLKCNGLMYVGYPR